MKILIADSGSTKTAWRLADENRNILQFQTQGFNPFLQSSEDISEKLKNELIPFLPNNVANEKLQIYFYGAGCSSEKNCEIVRKGLSEVFPESEIEIEHDLLAAARAACGHFPGIVAILGTGSNSCQYDGEKIIEHVPSLGYILGDEGSGGHIGKLLIRSVLYEELPQDLRENFFKRYDLTLESMLDSVYKQPFPNRYLASFSKFVYQNIRHPYMLNIVIKSFEGFLEHHICKYSAYQRLKLNVIGSVGFYYSNTLREVAADKGISLGKVLEDPIAGLMLYHLGE
jgi:glucosamine kinase